MTGYRPSVSVSAKAISIPDALRRFCLLVLAGVLAYGLLPFSAGLAQEKDADGMQCQYDPKSINIGTFKFDKAIESSAQSTFFAPHVKVTYKTYGGFFGLGGWGIIQDESADLMHSQCTFLIGMRFCARYAVGANGLMPDGSIKEDADYGYDPGDRNNPYGTCVSPFRTDRGPNSPTLWSDEYYHEPVRLCAYEDSKDGMDTEDDTSPFHKNTPNDGEAAQAALIAFGFAGTFAGIGLAAMVPVLFTGIGALAAIVFVAIIIAGALTALITSHLNHVVMGFTPGTSLGCVDIPLPPMPGPFYYQLEEMPPIPQVFAVTDNPTYWAQHIDSLPQNYIQDISSPKHPDNWRYEGNNDWFYPKIGLMLGTSTFINEDGKRVLKNETPPTRATAVLTGDFYGEGPGPNYGAVDAGADRAAPLPPLSKANLGTTGTTQARTMIGINSGDPFRIRLPGTTDRWVGYDVTTEVYNEEVCAYIINATWDFRQPPEGEPPPPPLSDEPYLIGCVKRPNTYVKLDGSTENAPPLPQVFHPWESSKGSLTPSSAAVSTYDKIRVWQWLRDDPRHPAMGVTPNYAAYTTDGVNVDSVKAAAAYEFAFALGMQDTVNPTANALPGGPVLALVPKVGCDSLAAPAGTHVGDAGDYFKRGRHRLARVHGKVYCMNNTDENSNGILDASEESMCATGASSDAVGYTLEIIKTPKTPDRYVPVTFPVDVTVKVPTLPFTENAERTDFNGTFHTLPAGTDINTLNVNGEYQYQTRILSADRTVGCPAEVVLADQTSEIDSQGKTVNVDTYNIVPAASDCPQVMDVSGTAMFYRTVDQKRGEAVMEVGGKPQLMKRVDADGSAPNQFIRKAPVFRYPRLVTGPTGATETLYQVDPVVGECPLLLQDDGVSLQQQMQKNHLCLVNPDGTPDETTVPGGVYQNVPIASRIYYPPDFYRGELLLAQTSLQQGLALGFCVALPPSQCPAEGGASGNPITAGGASVASWGTAVGARDCISGPLTDNCEVGKGIGEGVCVAGYGVDDNPTTAPQRYCTSGATAFGAQGTWGEIVLGKECQRLICETGDTGAAFEVEKSGVTYGCTLPGTAYSENGQAAPGSGSVYREATCSPVDGGAGTIGRRKYCNINGQWEDWSYDSIQAGKAGECLCDTNSLGCTGCAAP